MNERLENEKRVDELIIELVDCSAILLNHQIDASFSNSLILID